MDTRNRHRRLWALVAAQRGAVARPQLLALGYSADAIRHRVRAGRLHPVWAGVYAVGRPELTPEGRWMAAVLACGPSAALEGASAAELLRVLPRREGPIAVVVRSGASRTRAAIDVHRRRTLGAEEVTERRGIPVTRVETTLVLLAARRHPRLEAAVAESTRLGLVDPDRLRAFAARAAPRPGCRRLLRLLDRETFVLTDSELERRLLPLARSAGLTRPETQVLLDGDRVDFLWRELGLVVETDGLTYHRTAEDQARDRRRDQRRAVAGLTPLRFTHAQVRFEPARVEGILAAVAARLSSRASGRAP